MNQILIESLQLYRANMQQAAEQTNDSEEVEALYVKANQANHLIEQFRNPQIRYQHQLADGLKDAIDNCLTFDIGVFVSETDRSIQRYSNYVNQSNIEPYDREEYGCDFGVVWSDCDEVHEFCFRNEDLEAAEKLGPGTWLVRATNSPELVNPIWTMVQIRTFSAAPSDLMIEE